MKITKAVSALALFAASSTLAETTVIHEGALFPEGALHKDGTHFFVELVADKVMKIENGEVFALWNGDGCAPASVIDRAEGFLVACNGGSKIVQLDADGNQLWEKGEDQNGVALNQPNDLAHGQEGTLWITASGAPDPAQQPGGQVFYMAANGDVSLVADGLSYANGLALAPDGETLLVADMFNSRILAYPVDGDQLGESSVWANMAEVAPNPEGGLPPFPDGMEFGADGKLYVAVWGGQKIVVFNPDGSVASEMETPLLGTTNLTFIDDNTLLVTGVDDISGPPFEGRILEMSLN